MRNFVHTLNILRKGLPRALIVLLGPVKVGGSSDKTFALLKSRCPCFESVNKIRSLYAQWVTTFTDLQDHFNSLPPLPDVDLDRYGVLAIPATVVSSREPFTLFVEGKSILNRKGHTYAGKWLWNRLISGSSYVVNETLANEPYRCPQLSCPYLRTTANEAKCTLQSLAELAKKNALDRAAALDRGVNDTDIGEEAVIDHHTRIRRYLLPVVAIVIICAFISVTSFGTFFYRRELKAIKDRHEQNPEDEKVIDGEQPESQGRNAG